MSDPTSPAQRHRARAAAFGDLVAGTSDWEAPTPVAEWTARDVVRHLVEWLPGFLAGGGVDLGAEPVPDVEDDPAAAWRRHAGAVQALLDERGGDPFHHPQAGDHRLADAIDLFYTADVFMHSWDLARATGQTAPLDEATCASMLDGMGRIEQMLRGSGQFGTRQPVSDDATAVERLMAFIGRDPHWQPPARTAQDPG